MSRLLVATITLAAAAVAMPAAAQFQKPEDAVKYRQGVFTVMGAHFGRIGAMVNNRIPFDAAQAAANADIVATMSKLPYVAFVDGTAAGSIPNTRARPEIWTDRAKFDAAALKLQEEAGKLTVAAKSGNQDQLKTAFGGVGQACKACHDNFQQKQ